MSLFYYLNTLSSNGSFVGLFAIFLHLAITLPLVLIVIKIVRYILDFIPFW